MVGGYRTRAWAEAQLSSTGNITGDSRTKYGCAPWAPMEKVFAVLKLRNAKYGGETYHKAMSVHSNPNQSMDEHCGTAAGHICGPTVTACRILLAFIRAGSFTSNVVLKIYTYIYALKFTRRWRFRNGR